METLNLDENIEVYEEHAYTPITGTNINQNGEIRIIVTCESTFLDISESYLVFEGQLVNKDGKEIVDESTTTKMEMTTLVNNGLMFLFSQIKYTLSDETIETINDPGITTTMMGLLKYSENFEKCSGMNQLWCRERSWDAKDGLKRRHNYITTQSSPKGYFAFSVPLKHIFGFCESYDKVIYGFTHELILTRKENDKDVIIRQTNEGSTSTNAMVDDCKVKLDKLSWSIPHVKPNLETKYNLMKQIANKTSYVVEYQYLKYGTISVPQTTEFEWRVAVKRSPEKPRFIIVGFQHKKKLNFNNATFDHLNLKEIYATLNSRRYPEVVHGNNFEKNQFTRLFKDAAKFKQKYYNMDGLLSSVNLTSTEYKDFYPLFVIDVSKHSEEIKNGLTDILVHANFDKDVPEGTVAYSILVSDRIVTFGSDGSKFSVLQK